MAILTDIERSELHSAFMVLLSAERDSINITKTELRAAIDALDQWIEDNASQINQAIPLPARTELTTRQKALLFFYVADKRYQVL